MAVVCCMYECRFVSGSALRMDGQLTVYNLDGGPCYRCIFPVPPPPETVTNCSEGGVLGVVPGITGSIQALEVIKIIVGMPAAFSQKMLLLDAELGSFRTVRLRAKNADCAVCGINPSITAPIDYVQFCGASAHDKTPDLSLLEPHERISVEQLRQARDARTPRLLLDVRGDLGNRDTLHGDPCRGYLCVSAVGYTELGDCEIDRRGRCDRDPASGCLGCQARRRMYRGQTSPHGTPSSLGRLALRLACDAGFDIPHEKGSLSKHLVYSVVIAYVEQRIVCFGYHKARIWNYDIGKSAAA